MSDEIDDFSEFRAWLASKGYKGRYLGDIVSRLKRAMKISGVDDPLTISIDNVTSNLKKNGKSIVVVGHVKSAVQLYSTFRGL